MKGIALNRGFLGVIIEERGEARAGTLVGGPRCTQRHRVLRGRGTAGLFECYKLMLVFVLSSTMQTTTMAVYLMCRN